jgi:hypothetical protein
VSNNKIIYNSLAILTYLFISSCNIYTPTTTVITQNQRASITFDDKESEAIIYVNNIKMGAVRDYSNRALFLENGTHLLEIIDNGYTTYKQKIFISGGEIRKINLK